MAVVSVSLKETTYRKGRYLAQQRVRTFSGLVRHLLMDEIRAYEAEHGEIVLPKELLLSSSPAALSTMPTTCMISNLPRGCEAVISIENIRKDI